MLVREYTEKDSDALTEIWYDATLIAHSFIPKELWDAHKGDLKAKYLPVAETWVVEKDNEPVGFISLMDDYIGGLFVAPPAQEKGIGALLIKHVQSINDILTVSVYKENQGASRFYERHGFVNQDEEVQEETGHVLITMIWKKQTAVFLAEN